MGMGLGGIIYNLYTIQDIKVLIKRVCVCVHGWVKTLISMHFPKCLLLLFANNIIHWERTKFHFFCSFDLHLCGKLQSLKFSHIQYIQTSHLMIFSFQWINQKQFPVLVNDWKHLSTQTLPQKYIFIHNKLIS